MAQNSGRNPIKAVEFVQSRNRVYVYKPDLASGWPFACPLHFAARLRVEPGIQLHNRASVERLRQQERRIDGIPFEASLRS